MPFCKHVCVTPQNRLLLGMSDVQEFEKEQLIAIGARFEMYYRAQGLTRAGVAQLMGVDSSFLARTLEGTNFSSEFLLKIKHHFPNLKLLWLISGIGNQENTKDKATTAPETQKKHEARLEELNGLPTHSASAKAQLVHDLMELIPQGFTQRMLLLSRMSEYQRLVFQLLEPYEARVD